ncbi:MAG TPA: 4,5-DOPA dioxygenase extradiol [Bacteroidales bacterium]|nr:4,5-DOPA dioxygenase extradiol [Bacteroidales bacterium]
MNLNRLNDIKTQPGGTGKMPVLFLGHGSPMNAIEENEFVAGFRMIAETIPPPLAILCISAHWETKGTFVTAMENPPTIHDFGGFPKKLFDVQYPAPGSPELAKHIKDTVRKTATGLDMKWGLDHGAWSVIKHLYPDAGIPVVQMSLDYYQTIDYHYELAGELADLRNKGILVIGSGNIVHNLSSIAWDRLNDDEYGFDWAFEARDKMRQLILSGDHKTLTSYLSLGSSFRMAIPTPEHFLPLLYALALQKKDEIITLFNDKVIAGSIGMTSLKIG